MGKGGLTLWPLFGGMNQLLAGLAFLVIATYLARHHRPVGFLLVPMIMMLIIPAWALAAQIFVGAGTANAWIDGDAWWLVVMGGVFLLLELWMLIEAIMLWTALRRRAIHV